MKMSDVAGDHGAIEVIPGARADSIARVDGRLTGAGLRAEIGVPRPSVRTNDFGGLELDAARVIASDPLQLAQTLRDALPA